MSTMSILTMIIILGTVIGGFLYFLILAINKEKEHARDSENDSGEILP